jgi:hypothetical protein
MLLHVSHEALSAQACIPSCQPSSGLGVSFVDYTGAGVSAIAYIRRHGWVEAEWSSQFAPTAGEMLP